MSNRSPDFKTVADIQEVKTQGPWDSKSGGKLYVLLALGEDALMAFLDFDNPEFVKVEANSGVNIRGLREYKVHDISKGKEGGREWHKARTEFITVLSGRAVWECVDLAGQTKEYELDESKGVIMPPGILHSYRALQDGTTIQVVCNTLFRPDDPRTYDTYPDTAFSGLVS